MQYVSPIVDMSAVQVTVDDAWFLVLLAILLVLGATIVLGAAVWCLVNKHGKFTGNWSVKNWGVSISLECT